MNKIKELRKEKKHHGCRTGKRTGDFTKYADKL